MTDPATARRFRYAHAAHADWRTAVEQCLLQLDAQTRVDGFTTRASLGFVYFTDLYAAVASEILTLLKVRTGIAEWVGTVGLGICATGVEYFDQGAMAVMLADFPAEDFHVFAGDRPPPVLGERTAGGAIAAHAALVHADPATPDTAGLVDDMSHKLESGWLFGGLTSSRAQAVQIANRTLGGDANAAYGGGASGVVFSSAVHLCSRVTQGCHPLVGHAVPAHAITAYDGHLISELDGAPALDVLLEELGAADVQDAARVAHLAGGLFAGLTPPGVIGEVRFDDLLMRQVVAIDPAEHSVGVAALIEPGQQLTFCTRNPRAARADLIRVCHELRAEVRREVPVLAGAAARTDGPLDAQDGVRGALYVSCLGRSEQMFGARGAELALIREHLGEIPLVGFFANGEIARSQVHSYTGVLTLFL